MLTCHDKVHCSEKRMKNIITSQIIIHTDGSFHLENVVGTFGTDEPTVRIIIVSMFKHFLMA